MASTRTLGTVAAVLAAAGVGLVSYGVAAQEPAPPTPPRTAVTSGSPEGPGAGASGPGRTATPSPRRSEGPAPLRGPVLPASEPVAVRIPRIDVSARTIDLGLDDDGSMAVPRGGDPVGWYAASPPPGTRGPAILAAHVTWNGRPGAFFRLGELRPRDRVEVERADGTTAVFEVTKIGRYPKEDFPTVEVYHNLDHAGLRLITCGGDFDESTRHYVDNVVVYAELVGSHRA